jgi:hypothetical protein
MQNTRVGFTSLRVAHTGRSSMIDQSEMHVTDEKVTFNFMGLEVDYVIHHDTPLREVLEVIDTTIWAWLYGNEPASI